MNSQQRENAVTLLKTGVVSRRGIARAIMVPRSTTLDFLRKYDKEEFARLLDKLSRGA